MLRKREKTITTSLMSNIEIRTVKTKKDLDAFIKFHTDLYKDSPTDIPHLYMDERDTLTKGKNPSLDFCEAEYYLAYRDGKVVGRVAAIINSRANEEWNQKSVRFGWFDFIDDIEVSRALMERVEAYGKERGMEYLIGPLGFTDMDREGMQISGFDHMASMHANHNFGYYKDHMEQLGGFEKDNDWKQLSVVVPDEIPEKFSKVAKMVEKRYNLHARKMTRRQLLKEGYGQRFFEILNKCYSHLYNFSQLDGKQVDSLVKNYVAMADLNLVTIVTDDNDGGKMIGFGVSFPSMSEAMKRTKNGKLFPFGWYHLMRALFFHKTKTVDLLLVGILPEYRPKGANSLIFNDLIPWYQKYGFKEALTMPMMETNEGVLSQWQYLEAHECMRLRSYKKSLS